ncbi:MAG: ABC transporter substrate-binding protein/permease [Candidatus Methylacidiphilales bacterium]
MNLWVVTGLMWLGLMLGVSEAQPVLRWGGDAQGGAPYQFSDPRDPSKVIGFEVDLMAAVAHAMGRKAEFVQNEWSGLIPGLSRNDYEVALGGQEITPEHEEAVTFSIPYFTTGAQLVVRAGEDEIESLSDCRGKKVGTLKASLAWRMARAMPGVDVISYDDEVNAFQDVVIGRLDAALVDQPVAVYYGKINPHLKFVGGLVGEMHYGMALRKGNVELLVPINQALEEIMENGDLRRILERWGLWNELMAARLGGPEEPETAPVMLEQWMADQRKETNWTDRLLLYVRILPLLLKGAWTTLYLSVTAMVLAVLLGVGLGLARVFGPRPVQWLATAYVEVIRGTPLLIQLYFIFYGLPNLGIQLSPFVAAVLGLGLNYAAYEAENYRAGLAAVPRGQMEAALALGMTRRQALRHVVIPQAFRVVIPPITNDFISLLKDSSLVSVITMVELTKIYSQLATTYFDYLGIGVLVAGLYLLLGLPFVRLARWTEETMAVDDRHRHQRPGLFPKWKLPSWLPMK